MDEKNRQIRSRELLEPNFMISMYAGGAFPMAEEDGTINWYLPDTRAVIPVNEFSIPRSLKKFMETTDFEFGYDKETMQVVKECANREKTWISDELIKAYQNLNDLGFLHSVEVYQKNKLVGGLYGVTFRGTFFGESMFSKKSQASKTAMVKLFERLKINGFTVVDVQFMTDHLAMFGAREISFREYEELLIEAYSKFPKF
ncbi:MAG: leucyl/phenylalanyl-tRNA--protein transferase [Chlorobi bacterium]|nr:leucyl/phenylalanyl-tRNA--protein transferase [Chlorobiota bacterium]